MSVNPGFGGQRFIQTMTSKLRRARKLLDEYNPTCDLEVDGGIGVAISGKCCATEPMSSLSAAPSSIPAKALTKT